VTHTVPANICRRWDLKKGGTYRQGLGFDLGMTRRRQEHKPCVVIWITKIYYRVGLNLDICLIRYDIS
jgi:hypothetical protein